MTLAKFDIQLDALGRNGVVKVNDADVSKLVSGLLVRAAPGEMTVVELEVISGDTRIEGEGVVQVNGGSDGIVEFLEGIDPDVLATAALNAGDYGTSPMVTVLEVLKGWARGHDQA